MPNKRRATFHHGKHRKTAHLAYSTSTTLVSSKCCGNASRVLMEPSVVDLEHLMKSVHVQDTGAFRGPSTTLRLKDVRTCQTVTE